MTYLSNDKQFIQESLKAKISNQGNVNTQLTID